MSNSQEIQEISSNNKQVFCVEDRVLRQLWMQETSVRGERASQGQTGSYAHCTVSGSTVKHMTHDGELSA